MTETYTRCLCCGQSYAPDYDCPNADRSDHSVDRAVRVALDLRERGIEHPSMSDVQTTVRRFARADRERARGI